MQQKLLMFDSWHCADWYNFLKEVCVIADLLFEDLKSI